LPASIESRIAESARDMVVLQADDPVPLLNELTGWALAQGAKLDGLEVTRPSLEETYLALIAKDDAERGKAA